MHNTLRYLTGGIALVAQLLYASEAHSSIPRDSNPRDDKSGIERVIENPDSGSSLIILQDPLLQKNLEEALDHFNLSLILYRSGLTNQAQEEYGLAITILPEQHFDVLGLYDTIRTSSGNKPPEYLDNFSAGKIFLRQQKYNDAIIEFDNGLCLLENVLPGKEKSELLIKFYNGLLEAHLNLGNWQEAIEAGIHLGNETNVESALMINKAYFKLRDYNNALRILLPYEKEDMPDSMKMEVFFRIGNSYYNLGAQQTNNSDNNGAIESFKLAIKYYISVQDYQSRGIGDGQSGDFFHRVKCLIKKSEDNLRQLTQQQ